MGLVYTLQNPMDVLELSSFYPNPQNPKLLEPSFSRRSYPERLGDSIHELYVEELRREPRGDLRVNKTPKPGKSQLALFQELELGDVWQDADLLPVFQYLYFSARTRTINCIWSSWD